MKNIVCGAALIILVLGSVLMTAWIDNHYNREAKIVEISGAEIKAIDDWGYLWEFEGEGFSVGDDVVMIMDNRHTDTVTDDKVIGVK